MWEFLIPVLVLATPVAFGVVLWLDRERNRWRRAWERVASRFQLQLAPVNRMGPPAAAIMHGEIDGRACGIDVSVGRHQPVRARALVAAAAPPGFSLRLEREDLATWLEKKAGSPDLQVGEADFDARYLIHTSDAQLARRILDAPTRAALLKSELDLVVVTADGVAVETLASVWSNAERLATRTADGLDAALVLAGRADALAGGSKPAGQPATRPVQLAPPAQLASGERQPARPPALARAVRPALWLLAVLALLGGSVLVRAWQERGRVERERGFVHEMEVFQLAADLQGLAFERDLRSASAGLRRRLTPTQEELFSRTASGRAFVEERRRQAAAQDDLADDRQRVAALREKLSASRARQADPEAFLRQVTAKARELADSATADELEQVLREVLEGAAPAPPQSVTSEIR